MNSSLKPRNLSIDALCQFHLQKTGLIQEKTSVRQLGEDYLQFNLSRPGPNKKEIINEEFNLLILLEVLPKCHGRAQNK